MFADSFASEGEGLGARRPTRTRSRSPMASGCPTSSSPTREGKEVFVEIFGFWRKGDIEQHYKKLQKEMAGKFVLCVSEQMRADEDDDVTFGNAVYRFKRTPLPEEVARVAGLVAG